MLLALTSVAAYFDLKTRRIPNWLTLGGCVAGLAANTAVAGFGGLRASALGLGIGFVLYFPLWLLGARGAGDVKLLAAAGAVAGPANTAALFLLAAVLGGVFALTLVLARGATRQTFANIVDILSSLVRLRRPDHTLDMASALRLPHAPVIFMAAIVELLILRSVR